MAQIDRGGIEHFGEAFRELGKIPQTHWRSHTGTEYTGTDHTGTFNRGILNAEILNIETITTGKLSAGCFSTESFSTDLCGTLGGRVSARLRFDQVEPGLTPG
jgi:hypothetical protein